MYWYLRIECMDIYVGYMDEASLFTHVCDHQFSTYDGYMLPGH